MLTALVTEYNQIQQQIKDLEKRKKSLKAEIDLKLSAVGESRYEDTQYSAVLSESQRVRYNNESLMRFLLDRGFSPLEISTPSLDLQKVEALVASGSLDALDVAKHAEVRVVKTLTVKEK